jgi:hypothetical protein
MGAKALDVEKWAANFEASITSTPPRLTHNLILPPGKNPDIRLSHNRNHRLSQDVMRCFFRHHWESLAVEMYTSPEGSLKLLITRCRRVTSRPVFVAAEHTEIYSEALQL